MTIYDQDYLAELDAQSQAVPQQNTGVEDSAAESPVAIEEPAEQQVASASNEDVSEKELNFKALRETIAREKTEREAERLRFQQELDHMRLQLSNQQAPKKALDQESDEDLLTVGKYRQHIQEQEQQLKQQEEAYRLRLSELETKMQNPDYDEVMEKYSIPLLQNNRDFAQAFQYAENKAQFAYNIGKMYRDSQGKEERVSTEPSKKAERIIENSRKPGTLSSARGGQPSLSKAEYYASLSDAEFNALVEKNLSEV